MNQEMADVATEQTEKQRLVGLVLEEVNAETKLRKLDRALLEFRLRGQGTPSQLRELEKQIDGPLEYMVATISFVNPFKLLSDEHEKLLQDIYNTFHGPELTKQEKVDKVASLLGC